MTRWQVLAVVTVLGAASFGTLAVPAAVGAPAALRPTAGNPGPKAPGAGRTDTLPYQPSGAHRGRAATVGATLPLWSRTTTFQGQSITAQMVGTDPFVAQAAPSTTIDNPIIPIRVKFSPTVTTDPTAVDAACSQPRSAMASIAQSPIYTNHAWTFGGTSVGTTQYADAFRRANFYAQTKPGGLNPGYHLLLGARVLPTVTVDMSTAGRTQPGYQCGTLGLVERGAFDSYLRNTVFPALASSGVAPGAFPLFVLYNTALYDGNETSCCVLGYHSAFDNPAFGYGLQTYGVAGYQTNGSFDHTDDITTISHEVSEWSDDPTVGNLVPAWGHIGQVPDCQDDLEVGDPLTGTEISTPMPNGTTYHPQELAFASWFLREPTSTGVNGWYSSNGTFGVPPPVCSSATAPAWARAVAGNRQATVTWATPAGGDPSISGYAVTPYANGTPLPTRTFGSTATSQVLTGLTNGVAYRFSVAVVTAAGTGPPSTLSPLIVPPFGTVDQFLTQERQDVVGRSPTAAELTAGEGWLASGLSPASHVAALRRNGDAASNVDPTTRLYFAYFLRIPDVGGLSYWIGRKRGGTTLSAVSDAFAGSAEFRMRYGARTNLEYVNLVYVNVLGRAGDPGGVSYWAGRLDRHTASRGQVMTGFSESAEYKGKEQAAVDVAVTWIDLLHASPDQPSFDPWVTGLTSGAKHVVDLAAALLADDRYSARFGT